MPPPFAFLPFMYLPPIHLYALFSMPQQRHQTPPSLFGRKKGEEEEEEEEGEDRRREKGVVKKIRSWFPLFSTRYLT